MVNVCSQQMLLRVLSVFKQDRHGAIFRGQMISPSGEIMDTHHEVVARVQSKALSTTVRPGQWWQLQGSMVARTYTNAGGFQMTEQQLEVGAGNAVMRMPAGGHIVDYLVSNPLFEGIGQVTAQRLWETFQSQLVDVLDRGDHQALETVVSPAKATVLVDAWKEEGLGETLQWLQANDVSLRIGRSVVRYFGSSTIEKIKENPYRLLSFAAGWSEVDTLATAVLGVKADDPRRMAAAVEEAVYRKFSLGDTLVRLPDLVEGVKRVVRDEPDLFGFVDAAITHCESTGRLLFDLHGNAYSLGASILENTVVDCIWERSDVTSPPCPVDAIVAACERKEGSAFRFAAEQLAAVHLVAAHHFAVVTGGAGCGKTTVLKAMCEVLEAQGFEILQTALAGKAVKRMHESTGRPSWTLATLIKRHADGGDASIGQDTPTALLIDEASMVDLISFSALANKLHRTVKIVLMGDPHQLPPIGPGLILHCLTSANVPHVELKVGKRFGSEIAHVANKIRDGSLPELAEHGAVRLMEVADHEMAAVASKFYLDRPLDTVVLSTTRQVARTVNQLVQAALSEGRREVLVWNDQYECMQAEGFKEGDVVICTRNHWDLGLQNGSIGRLRRTWDGDEGDSLGEIEWDDGTVRPFDRELLASLELGYALTVHKSQGSQWKRVVVCLPSKSRMIDRSLVYTALTRAQIEVVLLTNAVELGVHIAKPKAADRRQVGLPRRLAAAGLRPSAPILA